MASAKKLFDELAGALAWTSGAVEAYGLELRRMGWWPETKRGRGASEMTTMDAAKLLVALLSDGPKSLAKSENDGLGKFDNAGFFLRTCTMADFRADRNHPRYIAVREELDLAPAAEFLEFVDAAIKLFASGQAERLFHATTNLVADPWNYTGPDLTFAVKGPFPTAEMRFFFSETFREKLVANGVNRKDALGEQRFVFLHQAYGKSIEGRERGGRIEHWNFIVDGIREHSALGIRYEKSFGGREIAACARAVLGTD